MIALMQNRTKSVFAFLVFLVPADPAGGPLKFMSNS